MSAKHTPTPWRACGQMIVCQENGFRVAEVAPPDHRARGKELREDWEFCRGNTEFIVRAVNNHAPLVQALKDCLELLRDDGYSAASSATVADAEAALAAAGVRL